MTEKEFNLSEKRKTHPDWKPPEIFGFYWESDVKEFIQKLKEEILGKWILNKREVIRFKEIIDNLAGKELIDNHSSQGSKTEDKEPQNQDGAIPEGEGLTSCGSDNPDSASLKRTTKQDYASDDVCEEEK